MAKVKQDRNCCIGCGACVGLCPEVFEMASDGKAKAKTTSITDNAIIEKAKQAEAACPGKCIKIS